MFGVLNLSCKQKQALLKIKVYLGMNGRQGCQMVGALDFCLWQDNLLFLKKVWPKITSVLPSAFTAMFVKDNCKMCTACSTLSYNRNGESKFIIIYYQLL